jgi:hypothetical protein
MKEFAVGGKKERDENEDEGLFYISEVPSNRFKRC